MADYARGQRLRELREQKHTSQEAVAFEVGVSVKTLRTWEHGGKIRWPNARRLGSFYGVDPEELVSREEAEATADGRQPLSQLDKLAAQINDLHVLFFGDGADVAGIAARLLQTDESPPPSADDEPESPSEAQTPPRA